MGVTCSNSKQRSAAPLNTQQIASAIIDHQKQEKDYDYLASLTLFDIDTIRKLHKRFCEIDDEGNSDDLIDVTEFIKALNFSQDSLLGQRIFAYFDKHDSGAMNFRNFVMALKGLSPHSTLEEKISLSFYLYDLNQDGSIDSSEIRQLVDAALEMTKQVWTEQQRIDICDATFKAVDSNGDGLVQFEEYAAYCRDHPELLRSLTVDVQDIVKDVSVKRYDDSMARNTLSLTRGPLDSEEPKKKSKSLLKKMFRKSRVGNLREIGHHDELMNVVEPQNTLRSRLKLTSSKPVKVV